MASIKYDAQGFPVGELVRSGKDFLAEQEQQTGLLRNIRSDVRSIARAVGSQVSQAQRTMPPAVSAALSQRGETPRLAVAPRGRGAPPAAVANGTVGGRRAVAGTSGAGGRVAATTAARDSRGRFTAGPSKGHSDDAPSPSMGATLSRLSAGVTSLSASISGAENVDPTLAAASEVKQAVAPLGRGFSFLYGRNAERKKERWYQRFLKALTARKKDEDHRPAAGGSAGLLGLLSRFLPIGMLGAGLAMVPRLLTGLFTRILGPVATLWGSFELGRWIGGKIYEWLDSSGLLVKVFDAFDAIKVAFSNAWASVSRGFDTVVDGVKSAWKAATDKFTEAMSFLGSMPDKLGGVLEGIDGALRKIPLIGDAYAKSADGIKASVKEARQGFREGESGNTKAPAASAAQAVGRDVGLVVGSAKGVAAQAGAGFDLARGRASGSGDASSTAQRIARSAGAAVGQATNWVLGQTSKFFESGKAGAGAISSGKGDFGGVSYGTYQLSSRRGTVNAFLRDSGYASQFEGLAPGTAAFNAKWGEVAKNDPAFAAAQHDFIKRTHFDRAAAGLKASGLDLSQRGAAVQDALWSTSVQFGAGNTEKGTGAVGIFSNALKGRDVATMTDASIVAAVQDYKVANNERLFASSSAAQRAGNLARAYSEKSALARLATVTAGALPQAVQSNVPPAVPLQIPPMPDVKQPTQLNTPPREKVVVVAAPAEPGQNTSDRALAHIVTGGIGGVR